MRGLKMIKIKCPKCPKVLVLPKERLPKDKTIVFPCPDCKATIRFNLSSKPAKDDAPAPAKKEKGLQNPSPTQGIPLSTKCLL